ncbi:cation:proton antiporter [Flavobacterium sp. AS60]|uniref:cation:proton antiporter domain-containing protein n=1 Tax=Flavobacterium anseongense TaxID=2910677 RepID=UPI001F381532|nr:cation:proton antiporter [Flavobacterium sp. AS60]MCF6128781.1 cation:proton antiporter [Flavobacterium sp. AS60]
MTTSIIISVCILLILAYIFDISSSKTKIPSVILLLVVGWVVKQVTVKLEITVPDLSQILPILGTIGLILIVLEGSLELEFNKSKLPFIGKTTIVALLPLLLFSVGLACAFQYFGNVSFKIGLANAIPFAIISSAIAIPSAQNLLTKDKEFITYESSLSDIFGVLFFNFIILNDDIDIQSIGYFFLELIIILIITIIATMGLAFLLSKIKHHVKFLPIILMIVLIYTISKIYHLPALIFILLFGLFIGNLDEFKKYNIIQKLQPSILNKEVHKFKELITEIAFLVRALFFILFGYLINTSELINSETIIWAIGICVGIFIIRLVFIKTFRITKIPLLFIAPRGLITILLFLSIPINQSIELVNKSLIIQVTILTSIIMMIGLLANKQK